MHSVLSCYILDKKVNQPGEKKYVLQLLNTDENLLMTEACMELKGDGRNCEITIKMFLRNVLLQLCLNKKKEDN